MNQLKTTPISRRQVTAIGILAIAGVFVLCSDSFRLESSSLLGPFVNLQGGRKTSTAEPVFPQPDNSESFLGYVNQPVDHQQERISVNISQLELAVGKDTTIIGILDNNKSKEERRNQSIIIPRRAEPENENDSKSINTNKVHKTDKTGKLDRAAPATKEQEYLPPLRICRKPYLQFSTDSTDSRSATKEDKYERLPIEYQCSGTVYDSFGKDLLDFAEHAHELPNHSRYWGRRPLPLPADKTVLFLGNSHTKQTAREYICQYHDQALHYQKYYRSASTSVTFQNNSTIYLVYNSGVEHSLEWVKRLQNITQRSLGSFDAVVLGQFNGRSPDIAHTTYYQQMMNMSRTDTDVQFGKIQPPDVLRLAQVYDGPIVFVSNYGTGKETEAKEVVKAVEQLGRSANRTNVRSILARKYIPLLKGNECGTQAKNSVGICGADQSTSHRCTGTGGGHPDLIAFDVQEELFSLFGGKTEIISNTRRLHIDSR